MSRPSLRPIAVLALFLVLAASGPLAGKQQRSEASARPTVSSHEVQGSLWSSLWSLLTSLWNKAGCSLDPYGVCQPDPEPPGDAGCSLDPYGQCQPGT